MNKANNKIANVMTYSASAQVLSLVQESGPKALPTLAELNRRMNADHNRIEKLAKANTRRLTGKDCL